MIKSHYDNHLADYYSWMFGGYEEKLRENRIFFDKHHIIPWGNKNALDLGSGNGFQSLPLAERGFSVTAIDLSKKLTEELREKSQELSIEVIEGDILDFEVYPGKKFELIVCMGDTLTHLPSESDVFLLLKNTARFMDSKGKLILSFRDLNNELKDEQRFIPVRSDEKTIFTCFLEYFEKEVKVHDLIYERQTDGSWKQKISFYNKLKLGPQLVGNYLREAGFTRISTEVLMGFVFLIAEK